MALEGTLTMCPPNTAAIIFNKLCQLWWWIDDWGIINSKIIACIFDTSLQDIAYIGQDFCQKLTP